MRKYAVPIMLAALGLALVLCCAASLVFAAQTGPMSTQRCPGEVTWQDGFIRRATVSLRWIFLREETDCSGCVCVG